MLVLPWTDDASAALGPPHFVDETASVGIAHIYTPVEDLGIGGGVAVFDCNGDGRPDLYFAGGGQPAMLARNDSAIGGALRFTPIGDAVTDIGDVTGAYPLDVDGDGITDLAVLRVGGLDLLRGLGDCRFAPANAQWAVDGGQGLDDGVQRDLGGRRGPADARRRELPAAGRHGPGELRMRRQRPAPTPAGWPRVRAADPSSARAIARCRCCSAIGTDRGGRTSGSATTGSTTTT